MWSFFPKNHEHQKKLSGIEKKIETISVFDNGKVEDFVVEEKSQLIAFCQVMTNPTF